MSRVVRYRSALVIVVLGALLLAASIAVPVIAKKKKKATNVVIVNSPPVTFSASQTEANGSPFHGVTDASCPAGFKAVGTGFKWTPDRGATSGGTTLGAEGVEAASFTSPSTVHFRVFDDVDNLAKGTSTFVGQVTCIK